MKLIKHQGSSPVIRPVLHTRYARHQKQAISYFLMFLGLITSVRAGVTVMQNIAPGATIWPGAPIIESVVNPAMQASLGESFTGVGGCSNYSETFTVVSTNFTLQSICIYAAGGMGTGGGMEITLKLFDLGFQTSPNPSRYSPGADLFNSGNGLLINYNPQAEGVVEFDFTGSDQVALIDGHMYAFELDGALNSSPILWERTTNDTYLGGAAYRDRSWINGNPARDFSLAVYATRGVATPLPVNSTVTAPVPTASPAPPAAGSAAATPPTKAATGNFQSGPWIAGALGVIIILLAVLIWTLKRAMPTTAATLGVRSVVARSPNPADATGSRQPGPQSGRFPAELTEFAKQELVQGLYSQRQALLETQKLAKQQLADLESRFSQLQLPSQERIRAYEERIVALEKELAVKDDSVRELTSATLLLIRRKLEEEKERQRTWFS